MSRCRKDLSLNTRGGERLQETIEKGQLQVYKDAYESLLEKYQKLQRKVSALNLVNDGLDKETSALIEANNDLAKQVKSLRNRMGREDSCFVM